MRASISILAVAIAALGCSEALSPSTFAGSYALWSVNAMPAPATVAALPDSCTEGFGPGTLTLADGVFSLEIASGFGCPGIGTATVAQLTIGGSLSGRAFPLIARAIDPLSPSGATMEIEITVSGSDAVLILPAGAMQVAGATMLVFGPRQTLGQCALQ